MEEVEAGWICLIIGSQYAKREKRKLISKEVKRIFGKDFLDFKIIDDESGAEAQEYYSFVRCLNYHSYIADLKRSSIIIGVLPSYDNPSIINNSDVAGFGDSVEKQRNPGKLFIGDVVKIKHGDLENLAGIVVGESDGGEKYEVLFKLYTVSFTRIISTKETIFIQNIFDSLKIPVIKQ